MWKTAMEVEWKEEVMVKMYAMLIRRSCGGARTSLKGDAMDGEKKVVEMVVRICLSRSRRRRRRNGLSAFLRFLGHLLH